MQLSSANGTARDLFNGFLRLPITRRLAIIAVFLVAFLFMLTLHSGPQAPPLDLDRPYLAQKPDLQLDRDPSQWSQRRETVREAFQHAYGAYERYAFGRDELKPLSNRTQNNLNGWGLTIVDSLDTMLLMGFDKEFERGVEFVEKLNMSKNTHRIGFFETGIRYLGGFLSAYYLANKSSTPSHREKYAPILLQKADELGEILVSAFNTPSGLPVTSIRIEDSVVLGNSNGDTYLAEMASCQMEFKYLAHLKKESDYFLKSDKVMDHMESEQGQTQERMMGKDETGKWVEKVSTTEKTGLWVTRWSVTSGKMTGTSVSAGAMADSAFEYLLKQYLLSGRSEKRLLTMYLDAMDGIFNHLLYLSTERNLLYVTDLGNWANPSGNMEHLSCYLPGVLALGAKVLHPDYPWPDQRSSRIMSRSPVPPRNLKAKLDIHMRVAVGLAYTCWKMYDDTETGVGPENLHFYAPPKKNGTLTRDQYDPVRWGPKLASWERSGRVGPLVGTERWPTAKPKHQETAPRDQRYLLRPEALEAMYLLWKTTGDPVWRERGWKMFESINKWTRRDNGYSSIYYVNSDEPHPVDDMPSFFLAETLKYAWLNTLDYDPLPLDRIVFNTEAHPLPIFQWTPEEIKMYNIH
ncbi:related to alpha-mannosidase [Serendipita indica DSM 11827]|uniref:alpha-1,2-Mannosidase n=1 Tax=Serendipita indica (strain DSM 11827) TaxID=1109443 RepID=G4TK36_SERID|nr:related to alpha-mannosidase [Serendipita indica DSM 11827]